MSANTGTYLDRILDRTASDLIEYKQLYPHQEILRALDEIPPALPFEHLLRQENVSVIAEFKRASPSRGVFPGTIEPATVADEYIQGGARAISCLTDAPFFKASPTDLPEIVDRAHQATPPVGVLRKDFMIDPYQIDHARAGGVDCILLIVAALDDAQLRDFMDHTSGLGMSALVEVHEEAELERAMSVGATLLGINNRDLRTFNVDLATTERLASGLPSDITLVAESGVFTRADVERMARVGASAVLVGESLIVHRNRVGAVRGLAGVAR
jgi:indole-3-glycerol phosphate synthase